MLKQGKRLREPDRVRLLGKASLWLIKLNDRISISVLNTTSAGKVVQSWFSVNPGLNLTDCSCLCISLDPFLVRFETRKLQWIQARFLKKNICKFRTRLSENMP